jgi:hypothetical protein
VLEEQQEQMSDKRNKKTKVQEQPVIPEPIDASRILFNKHIEHNCHFIFIHIFYYNNRYSTREFAYPAFLSSVGSKKDTANIISKNCRMGKHLVHTPKEIVQTMNKASVLAM